jgi:hypothetical protein
MKMFLDKILSREKLSPKRVLALFSFIFILWTFYRYLPEPPAWVSELVLKPVVWLLPTFWLIRKIEKQPLSSVGITRKNLLLAFYWGIGLGLVFILEGFLTNILAYRGFRLMGSEFSLLNFLGTLVLSFATAISEEIVFRGYIFNRLRHFWKKAWLANLLSSLLFILIYLPVAIFVLGYTPWLMLVYLVFVFIFSLASGFVFSRTNNILASILLHVFWSWPVILFR